MGNIFAAESQQMALAPPPLAPPPPTNASDETPTQPQTPADDGHPGSYEDLHKKCKEIMPQCFEGGKLIVSKGLSNHFQTNHTLTMSSLQSIPSGYRFGATYIGTKMIAPMDPATLLMGDFDPNGNLNANIIHGFSQNLRTKIVAQFQDHKCAASQGVIDYKGKDFTLSLTLAQIDILNSSGVAVTQYLQNVTSKLSIGAELVYQYGNHMAGKEMAIASVAGRYKGNKWTLSGNLCPMMGNAHACYHHEINDQLQISAEVETNLSQGESVCTAGYQLEIPQASLTFKGYADSNWQIGATFEKKLTPPFPFVLAMSGTASFANLDKPQYRFGIGLVVSS